MNRLSKRTKILIGAAGLVLIAAIAVGVILWEQEVGGLSGATIIEITPSSVNLTYTGNWWDLSDWLEAHTSLKHCEWSVDNTAVAEIAIVTASEKSARIHATGPGSTTAVVKCGVGLTKGKAPITVVLPAPGFSGPDTVQKGSTITISNQYDNVTWRLEPDPSRPGKASLSATTGKSVTVTGEAAGLVTLSAVNQWGRGTMSIYIDEPLTRDPSGTINVSTGQSVTVNFNQAVRGYDIGASCVKLSFVNSKQLTMTATGSKCGVGFNVYWGRNYERSYWMGADVP